MIKELNHIGMSVRDAEKSIDFYKNVLKGTVIRDFAPADGSMRFTYIQIANGVVELIYYKRLSEDPDFTGFLKHVAFLLDDSIENVYEYLSSKGLVFTTKPKTASSGDGKLAFFTDYSKVSFEIIERKENIRIPNLRNPLILEFDHTAVYAAEDEMEKIKNFYLNDMGFRLRKALTNEEGNRVYYFAHGQDTLGIVQIPSASENTAGLSHITFRVRDVNEMKEYLLRNNVRIDEGAQVQSSGYGNILTAYDPDGIKIVFVDRPSLDDL